MTRNSNRDNVRRLGGEITSRQDETRAILLELTEKLGVRGRMIRSAAGNMYTFRCSHRDGESILLTFGGSDKYSLGYEHSTNSLYIRCDDPAVAHTLLNELEERCHSYPTQR